METSLKNIRKKSGYTLEDLAAASGLGKSTICNFENGNTRMSDESLKRIANVLNIDVDILKQFNKTKESGPVYCASSSRIMKYMEVTEVEALLDKARIKKD